MHQAPHSVPHIHHGPEPPGDYQDGPYHPHYTVEETEVGKLRDLSKVARLGSNTRLRNVRLSLPSSISAQKGRGGVAAAGAR